MAGVCVCPVCKSSYPNDYRSIPFCNKCIKALLAIVKERRNRDCGFDLGPIPKDPKNPTDDELKIMGYTRDHWDTLMRQEDDKK